MALAHPAVAPALLEHQLQRRELGRLPGAQGVQRRAVGFIGQQAGELGQVVQHRGAHLARGAEAGVARPPRPGGADCTAGRPIRRCAWLAARCARQHAVPQAVLFEGPHVHGPVDGLARATGHRRVGVPAIGSTPSTGAGARRRFSRSSSSQWWRQAATVVSSTGVDGLLQLVRRATGHQHEGMWVSKAGPHRQRSSTAVLSPPAHATPIAAAMQPPGVPDRPA
jgi:hypothetical protein